MNREFKILCLKNRIAKLEARPSACGNVIRKLKRQLRKIEMDNK
jgi:hypothetical protein